MEEKHELQPFRMHANLYYIGNASVSVHMLDTSAGLVIIDTGYPDMKDLIPENIEAMGFSPKNIVAIFHSHGHIDHYGNTKELVALSSAKTYISRIDNDILNGTVDLSWARELNLTPIAPFSCDVLMEDGQSFDFGNTQVRCIHTPGHTDGVMSFVITLSDGTVAAMHGGIGLNSMRSDFLKRYGLSFECRRRFKKSLLRLLQERVDLVLGNHPWQNNTFEKMRKILNGEGSILDSDEWSAFLTAAERSVNELMENDPE